VNGHLQTALTAKAADTANTTRDGFDRSTQSLEAVTGHDGLEPAAGGVPLAVRLL